MSIRKLKNAITEKLRNELPDKLSYHGLHHTLAVLDVCEQYIRRLKIGPKDAYLLRTAALIHDVGILWAYSGHEEEAVQFAKELLPKYGYGPKDIEAVKGMILATQIPQHPKTILEMILCDADLDYLGTDSFYEVGETLFREFLAYGVVKNEEDWDRLQVKFLTQHHYHTDYAKKYREPVKQKYLAEIKKKWNWA